MTNHLPAPDLSVVGCELMVIASSQFQRHGLSMPKNNTVMQICDSWALIPILCTPILMPLFLIGGLGWPQTGRQGNVGLAANPLGPLQFKKMTEHFNCFFSVERNDLMPLFIDFQQAGKPLFFRAICLSSVKTLPTVFLVPRPSYSCVQLPIYLNEQRWLHVTICIKQHMCTDVPQVRLIHTSVRMR